MTLRDVRNEIESMRAETHDPELRHAMKDNLYVSVLTEIAERRYNDAWDLARVALEAEKVPTKWSACP